MNYIKHLKEFYQKASVDDRLGSLHMSLYNALFQFWNMNRFNNPISLNRTQILGYCKIGSYHSYYKCLNELHRWGYIEYFPSNTPLKGSFVNMCNFSIGMIEKEATIDANSALREGKNDTHVDALLHLSWCKNDTIPDAKMHPSINNININNKHKSVCKKNTLTPKNNSLFISFKNSEFGNENKSRKKEKRKKVAPKKEKEFAPPSLPEVVAFFLSENYPETEARKFYFHFEANGWLVSGKTPMKNWQAAAHNWMFNAPRYETQQKPGIVKLNTKKDYGEPL